VASVTVGSEIIKYGSGLFLVRALVSDCLGVVKMALMPLSTQDNNWEIKLPPQNVLLCDFVVSFFFVWGGGN